MKKHNKGLGYNFYAGRVSMGHYKNYKKKVSASMFTPRSEGRHNYSDVMGGVYRSKKLARKSNFFISYFGL